MKVAIIYIHGKGGNAEEATHYKPLFPAFDVIGFDYKAETPWDAKPEFAAYFDRLSKEYDAISVIANSIGAFFAMSAPISEKIKHAYFISPIVDMEKLILNMMTWANVTEDELHEKKVIETPFGETLTWEYLCYVRNNPIKWGIPTHILCGENDHLTALDTMTSFAKEICATLHVMKGGEHWFHTSEQMAYLDQWIGNCRKRPC